MGWYKDASGKPVWQDDAPRGIPIGMQDPTMPYKAQGAALDNQGKAANIQNDAERIALERQRLELAKQAAANAASANGRAAQAEQRAQNAANAPIYDRMTAVGNLENVAGDIQRQYNKNFKGAPRGLGGLTEFVSPDWNPTNQAFNKRSLQAGPFIQSILGLGGKDADAAAEYERKVMPFIPQASNFDETNENTLGSLWDFIDAQKASAASKLGKPKPPPSYRHDRPPEQYGLEVGNATLQQEIKRLGLTPEQQRRALEIYNSDQRVRNLKAPRKPKSGGGWKIERLD